MDKKTTKKPSFWSPFVKPLNVIKTSLNFVPVVGGAAAEVLNQYDSAQTDHRLKSVEDELERLNQHPIEAPKIDPKDPATDFPIAAHVHMQRAVTIIVLFPSKNSRRGERYNEVGHGFLVAPGVVLTCKEALNFATDICAAKKGRCIAVVGWAWYSFTADPVNAASGLVLLRLGVRDDKYWKDATRVLGDAVENYDTSQMPAASYSFTPYVGEDVGFVHHGEAKGSSGLGPSMIPMQFERCTISHFKKVSDDGLKVFVTSVVPSRILFLGSAVFSRSGVLFGIVSGVESYPSDVGRRAVIRGLLGHPHFRIR